MDKETKTNLFEKELTSYRFNAVVRKAVKKSLKTGYEAGFGIFKHFSQDKLVYSPYIVLGDEEKMSWKTGFLRSKAKFLEKHLEKTKLNNTNFLKDKKFNEFSKKEEPFQVSLEGIIQKEFSWKYAFNKNKENPDEYFPLISFHTHPNSAPLLRIPVPSEKDMCHLNHLYKLAQDGDDYPMMAIANVGEVDELFGIPILLIQQTREMEMTEIKEIHGKITNPYLLFSMAFTEDFKKEFEQKGGYNIGYLHSFFRGRSINQSYRKDKLKFHPFK